MHTFKEISAVKIIRRSGCKDIWNAFMCKDAIYSKRDIPYCPTKVTALPKRIITWEEAKTTYKKEYRKDHHFKISAYVCFYIDDYRFDGIRTSIWFYPKNALRILKHFIGIITPDFSTYQDFPYPIKLYNTYRMRAFGYWIGKNGLEVINNCRWGTEESYQYCYDSIPENSIIAIGTVGGSPRKLLDRDRFEKGFFEMIDRLHPHTIIVYGSAKYSCFDIAKRMGISIIEYPSHTARYWEENHE